MRELEMIRGARILVDECANVKPGENVLIVADTNYVHIAQILAAVARERDTEVVICIMTPRKAHGENPPPTIVSAMMEADVIFEPTTYSLTRSEATEQARRKGARIVSMPAYTDDMLIHGGLEADFRAQEKLVDELADALTRSRFAKLMAPAGTCLTLETGDRHANTGKGFCTGPGTVSGPPNIEVNVSPIEGTAEGTIVVDVSVPIPEIGLLGSPIKLTVEKGRIVDIEGGHEATTLQRILEEAGDPNVYNIAELGIGLNPKARISGIMLEDEGALGTAHIGIGDNHTSGGVIKAPLHIDLVIRNPTLELDGRVVIKEGDILICC